MMKLFKLLNQVQTTYKGISGMFILLIKIEFKG